MITKLQLQNKLLELAKKAQSTGNFGECMSDYMVFIKDNHLQFDSEATEIATKAMDIVSNAVKENIEQMPDGIERRRLARMHAEAAGDHWNISEITDRLASKTISKSLQ